MSVFENYAQYYDLLYQDKDYEGESRFVHELISNYSPDARTILELGSGTGRHAEILARSGFQLCGVERSAEMLAHCMSRYDTLTPKLKDSLTFTHGDLRNCIIQRSFDAVISLFHVISYQTSNNDLIAAFRTARKHLKSSGLFIFDVWYGPAVMYTPPSVRVKRLQSETHELIRIAEPVQYCNENIVDVNYRLLLKEQSSLKTDSVTELHRMRYLFKPELELLLNMTDFKLIDTCAWLTREEISFNTWGACFIAQSI
ncbi:MAG: class I SAM-dependent DNA methyltransferase [Phormidesmis sp.]